ncbi:MAG: aspartate-semialdehyde dehydrogenase [Candidatus Bathyarchaeia archaeon]
MGMINVMVVGATGVVGQQFLVALANHPWFNVVKLAASQRSAGKKYIDAIRDESTGSIRWYCDEPLPEQFEDLVVEAFEESMLKDVDIVFSAVESDIAREIEPKIASRKPVISTASAFRYEEDVPLMIPGINDEHATLIEEQKRRRNWSGFIAPIPNCTTTGLAITLKPIMDRFGIKLVLMTSMQALSGAGRSPGVIGLDILDNIIPYIPREEEKVQTEVLKILGKFNGKTIQYADFKVSCTCTRVNVRDGHTESVFLSLKEKTTVEEFKKTLKEFKGCSDMGLPSAPKRMIVIHDDPYRPQPRLDRNLENGMATVVGRIREDPALENGIKYILLSHNTKMGAAKGAVLLAELLYKRGFI